ncbi:NETI motif-containing protein [Salimicrobium jeotgali]|uniref:NETI motif-containing protein n=1 Tax=Salimicrobium jeotgali TaxID=1230341 RepID=K2H9T4_9BACI|nr:NETI motif-containing protein [Salimicrobium jeotgali]AKG05209.1 NETI motif-containing protein [Salimicrobium jeotgali]EKE32410.1 hypothetical protein MJ3_03207 [Salimicrobium jeotgali]MBM7695611.1 hypothetical protein [Salimicrobium jeotgali]
MAKKKKESNKKRFEVKTGESIEDCLERIRLEGFVPVRRTEEPVFEEKDGEMQVAGREIVFEAKKIN